MTRTRLSPSRPCRSPRPRAREHRRPGRRPRHPAAPAAVRITASPHGAHRIFWPRAAREAAAPGGRLADWLGAFALAAGVASWGVLLALLAA